MDILNIQYNAFSLYVCTYIVVYQATHTKMLTICHYMIMTGLVLLG